MPPVNENVLQNVQNCRHLEKSFTIPPRKKLLYRKSKITRIVYAVHESEKQYKNYITPGSMKYERRYEVNAEAIYYSVCVRATTCRLFAI